MDREPGFGGDSSSDGGDAPPLKFGLKRAYYQFSVSVPQSHLVLVSVLEGVVFSALLTGGAPSPGPVDLSARALLQLFNAYAPYVLTAVVILLTWTDYVYASTVIVWPPTLRQTALIYMATVPQLVMAKNVANFTVWIIASSLFGVIAGLVRLNNRAIFRREDFEDERLGAEILRREGYYGWGYVALGVLGLGLIAAYGSMRVTVQAAAPFADPDQVMHAAGYLIMLVIDVVLMVLIARYAKYFLGKITQGSDLAPTPYGGLRYRKAPATTRVPR